MKRRGFGKKTVSAIGFGCMSFGGFYGPTTEAESMRALARALDLGIDFWDTANTYGNGLSETIIGKFLAEDPGRRARITLATKFAIRFLADGRREHDNSASAHARSPRGLDEAPRGRACRPLLRAPRRQADSDRGHGRRTRPACRGRKIGAIGLSEVAPDTLRRAQAVHPIAAVQSEYSLWTRTPELGLLQACAEAGALFVAFSPVGRALFSGVLQDVEAFDAKDFRAANPRFEGLNWRRNRDRVRPFLALARSWGVAPATLALAWVLARAPHIVPIPGTRTAEHLEECAAAADLDLDATRLAEIERILPVGFAAGERYADAQWIGIERY